MYYFYSLFHFLNKLDTFFIAHIVVKVTDGSDKKHLILAPYNNSAVDPGRGRGRQPIIWPKCYYVDPPLVFLGRSVSFTI